MAKGHLVRLGAEHDRQDLVSQADAEHRLLAHELVDRGDRRLHRRGIPRAVRQEDGLRVHAQHIVRTRSGRYHRDIEAAVHQALQDVALIVNSDVSAAQVESALRSGAGELLESITLFDRYDKLGDGKISLAFSLVFRAPDRTLTGAEVTEMREAAVAAAVKATGAILRTA